MLNRQILAICLLGLWAVPAGAQTWTELPASGAPLLLFHTAAYDPTSNRMIVFGGEEAPSFGFTIRNDVWVLTNANGPGGPPTWIQLAPTGGPPAPRHGRSTAYDPATNRLMVFGGACCSTPEGDITDTWVLTNANGLGGTPQWIELSPNGGPERFQANSAYDPGTNRVILFGGRNIPCHFCFENATMDVWVLLNANGLGGPATWIQLSPTGSPPASRNYQSMVYDSTTNRMIVFGGVNAGGFLTDTWVLTNANGLGGPPEWIQISADGGPVRYLPASTYDATTNRMIVFGGGQTLCIGLGCSLPPTNDVWVLINANGLGGPPIWTELAPTGGLPPERLGHTLVYDARTNRAITYAGIGSAFFGDTWVLQHANGTLNTGPAPALSFSRSDFTTTANPRSPQPGDFDEDGILDLAVGRQGGSDVTLLTGNGDGTFASLGSLISGDAPFQLIRADFNSDGHLDLAIANFSSRTVSVFLGNGNGTFASAGDVSTGSSPRGVASGDFNQDGNLDLAITNGTARTVSIFLGNGDGTFSLRIDFPANSAPRHVVTADFDRNGTLDLAVANLWAESVSVLLGNGDGTFGPENEFTTGQAPRGLATGDFNNDNIPDLVTSNFDVHTVSVLLGNGDGSFAPNQEFAVGFQPFSVTADDLNGDNRLDLATADLFTDTVSVLLGNGDGTFTFKKDLPVGPIPVDVNTGDFNGDSNLDLVVANFGTDTVSVLLNVNTPEGTNVAVTPIDATTGTTPVTLTYDTVTQEGTTSLATSTSGPPPPTGFKLGSPPTYYEVTTSAVFSGVIQICIDYSGVSYSNEQNLKLYHFEGGTWTDRTTSLDTTNKIICASVSSLSTFAVLENAIQPLGLQPPLAALVPEGESAPLPNRAFKQGSTLPLKLQLLLFEVFLTDLDVAPPRIAGLMREGEPVDLQTIDPDSGNANDTGVLFRFSDGNWVYNLSTKGLSAGTYVIAVEMPDGVSYTARFVLR